jgi:hypothetical protein
MTRIICGKNETVVPIPAKNPMAFVIIGYIFFYYNNKKNISNDETTIFLDFPKRVENKHCSNQYEKKRVVPFPMEN